MHSIDTPIQQAEAGWFTRRELQAYLGVGKNAVGAISDRFGLTDVEGCFDERDVWRRILHLEPVHDHSAHLLRIPLRDIVPWVDAEPVMASVPDDVIPARHFPVQDAVDEAIGRDLPPSELHPSRGPGIRLDAA
jgi:hypothetical protein